MKTSALLALFLVPVLALTSGCTTKTKVAQNNAETAPAPAPTPAPEPAKVAKPIPAKPAPTPKVAAAPKPLPTPALALNPVDVAVVDIKPRAYRQTRATYPSELQKSGTNGKVLLSFVLDTEGKPTQIKSIEASNDLFIKSAIDALSHWRFYPAQKDGLPVACNLQQLFVFNAAPK